MKNYSVSKYILLVLVSLSLVLTGKISIAASHSHPSSATQLTQADSIASSTAIINQGNKITFNGQPLTIPWQQWQSGQTIQTGVSDTNAIALGLELLSTNNPTLQPVVWFSNSMDLEARYQPPYRYLNLTNLAAAAHWQIETDGDTLHISTASIPIVENIVPATVDRGDEIKQSTTGSDRYIIELNHPTAWQVSQNPKSAVLTITAASGVRMQKLFPPLLPVESLQLEPESEIQLPPPPVVVESDGNHTKITFNFAIGNGVKVSSALDGNSYDGKSNSRLVVDVTPQSFITKDIAWANGISWHQRYIKLSSQPSDANTRELSLTTSSDFPVVWLEIDPTLADFTLKPITSTIVSSQGLAPLAITAQQWAATAAINGGFFNRNNQLPLGVVRQDYHWRSGPILNRGAIAWDSLGNIQIDRLTLSENLVVDAQSIPLIAVNSGYVKQGVSRYTPEWGSSYTSLIDDEIVFVVRNNIISERLELGVADADSESIPIPPDGYLLTVRADPKTADLFSIGAEIELLGQTTPVDWLYYPHIMGAGPLLLQQGQIVVDALQEGFSQAFAQQMADRSAIALNAQGQIILAAVNHRAGGRGPNLVELAQVLQQLGAVDALNLDGGSSASVYLGGSLINRSLTTAAQVHNGIFVFVKHH